MEMNFGVGAARRRAEREGEDNEKKRFRGNKVGRECGKTNGAN